ncbi:pre-mRNA-splicing factor ISY1 homolog isoform X6 [Dicentrarchus labrax]|uniref:pre-mRNA-splicing factor ISY1 homolog isoform X6 n=1 Tax=Dicentrarchus labrax TaxID=13489 RepID=UPI0021F626AE|nr:pre-mRNA-splicing factor ISY1 homolog isoform X6 [Dicentrarchus labrax]
MARNAEKAMTALARFRQAQLEEGKVKERRPFLASECSELPKAEKWRRQIISEISKKVAQIQNAGLGEFRIRDLNDEINKLLREKGHWEVRIKELGGPDYARVGPKMLDHEGKEVPGNRGYKYFGAARDLPGVRELFEKEPAPALRKTRAELMKEVDAEYYGYRDEDDGVLLPLEMEYEKQGRSCVCVCVCVCCVYTVCVCSVYILCVCAVCIYCVCAVCIYCVCAVCVCSVYILCVCSVCVQCVYTVCVQCVYTVCTVCVQCVYTVCTVCVCSVYILCVLCVCSVYILCVCVCVCAAVLEAVQRWRTEKESRLSGDKQPPEEEEEEEESIYRVHSEELDDEESREEQEGEEGGVAFIAHVPVPSQKEVEEALVRRKKMELLQRYASETLQAQSQTAKTLLGL